MMLANMESDSMQFSIPDDKCESSITEYMVSLNLCVLRAIYIRIIKAELIKHMLQSLGIMSIGKSEGQGRR